MKEKTKHLRDGGDSLKSPAVDGGEFIFEKVSDSTIFLSKPDTRARNRASVELPGDRSRRPAC